MESFKRFIEAKSAVIMSERDARKILKFPTSTMDFVSLTQYKGYYLVAEEDFDDDRSQMYFQVFDKSKKLVKVKIKNEAEFKAFVDKQ